MKREGKQSRRREKYGNVKVENVAMAFTVNGLWLHVRNGKKHTYIEERERDVPSDKRG